MTGKPARDAGFTLIELLLVIVILGVIVLPLSNAVIGVLRNETTTQNRMVLSHDAQVSTTNFAQDVAESQPIILESWKQRSTLNRVKEWMARLAAYWL